MELFSQVDAYLHRLIRESTPERTIWNIESLRKGKSMGWNYIDGCMITAILSMAEITGEAEYADFAENYIDSFIDENGSIHGYDERKYNLDDVNEGRVLFPLYERTGKDKYRLAAEVLKGQLDAQPRTAEGNFWHKAIYPNQVWLDGIYMAQPFRALYEKNFGEEDYSDIVRQIMTVRQKMFDEEKRLYFHGYDASRRIFWADPESGCSKSFWLRSIGWFAVALADLTEILPDGDDRNRIATLLSELVEGIASYADAATGMYWQVPDQGEREGNYLETSGSSMIAYAMLKGARLGVLDGKYAELGKKTFTGIAEKYLSFSEGNLNLGGICLVAGLGPADNLRRDGTYEYYISEPIVENDAKGVAPFLLAYTEVVRA